jgi:hypothetical protein
MASSNYEPVQLDISDIELVLSPDLSDENFGIAPLDHRDVRPALPSPSNVSHILGLRSGIVENDGANRPSPGQLRPPHVVVSSESPIVHRLDGIANSVDSLLTELATMEPALVPGNNGMLFRLCARALQLVIRHPRLMPWGVATILICLTALIVYFIVVSATNSHSDQVNNVSDKQIIPSVITPPGGGPPGPPVNGPAINLPPAPVGPSQGPAEPLPPCPTNHFSTQPWPAHCLP